jgi:hypothetical protein
MRETLREILPTLFACLVLLDGLFQSKLLAAGMQTATWLSAGMGEGVFSSRLARIRATKHEAAHAETEAVAEDGRCCMRRRKSPVWSTEATYLTGSAQPVCVPEGRSAALAICAGASI